LDFELSEEHRMLAATIRSFMDNEIDPIAMQIDIDDRMPDWIWRKLGELGWLGITIPEEYGGAGFDYLAQVIAMEEMSRISPAVSISVMAHSNLCADNLYKNGTEEQCHKYLPPLCTGEKIGALALTEPNAGSDAVSIQMTATRDGNEYVLNGNKMFITNGPIADTMIVYTKTEADLGAKGITAFIVEKGFPGTFSASYIHKMGVRGSTTGELAFDDYRVPARNILGEENRGIHVMMSGLDSERTIWAGWNLGILVRALELSLQYARDRVQFGKPIGTFQLMQAKLADMYVMQETGRLITYKAADICSKAERGGKGTEIHKVAAAAALYCAESATKAALDAVQIHGGYGYTLEFPVNRLLRDAKLGEIGAGTVEIRRMIIGEALMTGD